MDDDRYSLILESPLDDPGSEPDRRRHYRFAALGAFLLAVAVAAALIVTRRDDAGPAAGGDDVPEMPVGAAGTPGPRLLPMLISTPGGVLMLGGMEPAQDLDGVRYRDVWRYDSASGEWFDLGAPEGPEARVGSAAVYDAGSGLVVLFGGALGGCEYPLCPEIAGDTWVFDPVEGTWEERSPATAPSPRHGHAMTYHAGADRVVLFGGDSGEAWLDDTWIYDTDADAWTRLDLEGSPRRRARQVMTYDAGAGRVVLWGGSVRDEEFTWSLDLESGVWSRHASERFPSSAWDACMVWDPSSGRSILVGGEGYTTEEIAEGVNTTGIRWRREAWAFGVDDGWTMLEAPPEPMAYHGCALDPGSGGLVVWSVAATFVLDPGSGAAR